MRRLLIRLLLGRRKKGFYDIVLFDGKPYLVNICLYEPANEFIDRMEKALQTQGLKAKEVMIWGEA